MKDEGMTDVQADLVRDNLGGSPQEIRTTLVKRKNSDKQDDETLKFLIDHKVSDEKSRLSDMVKNHFDEDQKKEFYEVCEVIVRDGCFIEPFGVGIDRKLLNMMVEKDIWFYDSFRSEIVANSQSVRKAMETMRS